MSAPTVTTSLGTVRGNPGDGVAEFLGVPYGASTEGRRFLPPLPAQPWDGVFDATQHGRISPQEGDLASGRETESRTLGYIPALEQSEDCLVLNIWTPATSGGDDAKRPVMVWLHGRGFASGSGSEGWYNGTNLAKRGDVVVVAINHRLNVFGYLNLAQLGGDEFAGSGVAGILDIVEALRWVRANIAAFGGDPENVTIFGESGGGRKVCSVMAMPSAQGLFQRGIIQSSVTLNAIEPERGTELARLVIKHAGLDEGDVHGLQQLPMQALTEAYAKAAAEARVLCAPTIDATYFPHHPHDVGTDTPAPSSLQVPVILGTNKDENALFMGRDPRRRKLTEEELHADLQKQLGERWREILDVYREHRPDDEPWDLLVGITSEARRIAANRVADMRAAAGAAPTYMYYFTWESDFLGGLYKAAHAMEIPFVFDNTHAVPMTGERPDKAALAEVMSETWATFARTGDPNHPALPTWKPFTSEERAHMVFDVPSRAENDPRSAERLVWQGDLSQYR